VERLEDFWLPRIGEKATGTLMRAVLLSRIAVGIGVCEITAAVISEAHGSVEGESFSIIGGTVGAAIFSCVSLRLQSRARRQAGTYLALPPGAWKYLSVRSQERFDRWMAARDRPGWPAKGWR
jgi:hypothetical protein